MSRVQLLSVHLKFFELDDNLNILVPSFSCSTLLDNPIEKLTESSQGRSESIRVLGENYAEKRSPLWKIYRTGEKIMRVYLKSYFSIEIYIPEP